MNTYTTNKLNIQAFLFEGNNVKQRAQQIAQAFGLKVGRVECNTYLLYEDGNDYGIHLRIKVGEYVCRTRNESFFTMSKEAFEEIFVAQEMGF